MNWLLALVGLIGTVQAVVWIGQPSAPAGRRLLGVFAAPLALALLVIALAAVRVPGLLF
ncbi:MAG TPA: hypothetical protein VM869_32775 [Enhygromyxa sp.]|nr:hypothetical protein [Enhygromyxa sp.]